MEAPNWTLVPMPTKLTPFWDDLPLVMTFHWPLRSSSAAVPPNTGTSGNASRRASTMASSAPGVALIKMACGPSILDLREATAAAPSSGSYAVANASGSSLDSRSTPNPLATDPPEVRTAPLLVRPWIGVSPRNEFKLPKTAPRSRFAVVEMKAMLGLESPKPSLAALTAASAASRQDSRLLLPNPAFMVFKFASVCLRREI
mmetsp:Transcript_34829/g.74220  ORF Transcript_34829/g.74220 Transcript_34829/m.74220 type:complete len:202 (-) Transcript_34829:122-727(-)